jgi:UDP-2,4-diacetamido-2,4,6-trideoxy-beta-L-altropyranose hydrolase
MTSRPVPVIFRCDGGKVAGMGHVMRCITLARAFSEDGRATPQLWTYSDDKAVLEVIESHGIETLNVKHPAGSDEDLEQVRKYFGNQSKRPLFIADSRNISDSYLSYCQEHAYTAIVSDGQAKGWHCDAVIDNNLDATKIGYCDAGQINTLFLLGPDYNLLRHEFFATPRCRSKQLTVLITMGGEDPHDHTSWLIEELSELLADCDVVAIVGAAHPGMENVRNTIDEFCPHASLVVNTRNMAKYMALADIAFTAGGTTCYELAAMGVAQLAVILEEHQRPFVHQLEKAGCLAIAADYLNRDPLSARTRLTNLLAEPEERRKYGDAGKKIFSEPGAHSIVAALLHHYENILG